MRWALLLKDKRIIISSEMKSSVVINGNMLKKVSSGGDTLIGRQHCQAEEEFIMVPLAICFANDLPPIRPYDDAVDNRLRVVSYTKQYVDEPTNELELKKDENVLAEIRETRFRQHFVGLLIREYILMKQNGIPPEPSCVIQAKRDWVTCDASVIDTFAQDFELTNCLEDFVLSSDITDWIKAHELDISMKKFGMEMVKHKTIHKLQHIESKVKKINGKCVQIWCGIKKFIELLDED